MNAAPHPRQWQTEYADKPVNAYPHSSWLPLGLGLSLAIHLLVLAIWFNLHEQQTPLSWPAANLAVHLQNSVVKTASTTTPPATNCKGLNCRSDKTEQATASVSTTVKNKPTQQTIIKPQMVFKTAQTESIETVHVKKTGITASQSATASNHQTTPKPVAQISLSRVISRLQQDLKQYFYYPRLAQRKNIQGAVILGFAINQQGKIKNIRILKSSGFAILDVAAEDALRQLHQLNWEQSYLQRNNQHIELPVIYQLTES